MNIHFQEQKVTVGIETHFAGAQHLEQHTEYTIEGKLK